MNFRCIIRGFKVKNQPNLQDNGCFIFTLCLSYFYYEVFQNINSSEQFQRSTIINEENMIQVQNNINICEIVELGESMQSSSGLRVRIMLFNATFNNFAVISWWSVLLVEEPGVPGENHRPVTSH
jgi:hypothetical protein